MRRSLGHWLGTHSRNLQRTEEQRLESCGRECHTPRRNGLPWNAKREVLKCFSQARVPEQSGSRLRHVVAMTIFRRVKPCCWTCVHAIACVAVLAVATVLLGCNGHDQAGGALATSKSAVPSDTAANRLAEQMLPSESKTAYSLVELISNPERFENSRVYVGGFLLVEKSEFDSSQGILFLHRDDYELGLGNEVKIQFDHCVRPSPGVETESFEHAMALNRQYVLVRGFFIPPLPPKGKHERSPFDRGTICVTSIFQLEQRRK